MIHYHYCARFSSLTCDEYYIDGMITLEKPVITNEDYRRVKELISDNPFNHHFSLVTFTQHFDFGYNPNTSIGYKVTPETYPRLKARKEPSFPP